jgi:hypothetical protein
MELQLTTPVAFLIFNRPIPTLRVFEEIRKVKPQKFLIIADGARFPEEQEKCNQARSIVEKVDWNCEVLTNFSDINLGCKIRVSSGLDWVFSQVEEAIILEDDCLPTQSFFFFCQTLLEYYRYDSRVMHISGNNFQFRKHTTDYSYFFSKYGGIWGWASWRRAWQYYDRDMKNWTVAKQNNLIDYIYDDWAEKLYWTNIFDRVVNGIPNTWDYQWLYARWMQKELSIAPAVNLVSNIGFNSNATHTNHDNQLANMQTEDIWEIVHPPSMARDNLADAYVFDYCYGGKRIKRYGKWLAIIIQRLSFIKGILIHNVFNRY